MLAPKGLYVSIHFQIVSALGFYRFVQPFCNDITLFKGGKSLSWESNFNPVIFSHAGEWENYYKDCSSSGWECSGGNRRRQIWEKETGGITVHKLLQTKNISWNVISFTNN